MKVVKRQKNSKSCIICGMENQLGVKAPFYELEDGSMASVFEFKFEHQSYPGRTHGGMISAFLDELMGRVLWITNPTDYAVTTTMSMTFRKPVPYGKKLKARAVYTHKTPRWYSAKGYIYDENGTLLAEGEGRYFILPPTVTFGENTHADEEMCYDLPCDLQEIELPELKKQP